MVTTDLLMSIRGMEKGQEFPPGSIIEGDTDITAGIMDMGLLPSRNGAKIGHHHGSRMNGKALFSLECEKSEDILATEGHLVLEEREADSLDGAI